MQLQSQSQNSLAYQIHIEAKARKARLFGASLNIKIVEKPKSYIANKVILETPSQKLEQRIRDILLVSTLPPTDEQDQAFWRSAKPYMEGCVVPPIPKRIIAECLMKHRIKYIHVASECRNFELVTCRQEICYRLKEETSYSLPQIGRLLGGRDHTTVLFAIRRHKEIMFGGPKPNKNKKNRQSKSGANESS
jgi:hypothetical protein